ncbi:MAG: hypothetical protein HY059_04980 [Proteobacteria bacterium]|nr:hypothetical protein [Pseudomonadota bacterium]
MHAFALALLALAAPAGAMDVSSTTRLAVTHEFLLYENRVTGSNPAGSFLTLGKHTIDSIGMLLDYKPEGPAVWQAAFDGRATDDERIDRKRLNIKRFYVKRDSDASGVVVGDFFASFSEYTLGKSLKGAQVSRKFSTGTQVTVLGGIDKPNWDDLWNHNRGESVDRQVWGARTQQTFLEDGSVGLSGVVARDLRARYDDTSLEQDQRIVGVDWTLPQYRKVSLSGESAYSFTRNDQPGLDPVTAAPISTRTSQKGWAHKVRGRWSWGRFKTQDDFERVSPEYATTVGAASPDLAHFKTANTWTIYGPWKWIVLNYTYFHNNLNRQEGANISTTRMPETGLRYEAPDWRPDFAFETKWRYREVVSSQNGLRKRARSVLSSASDRYGPVSVTLDYEFQHEDKSDQTESLRHHIFGVGANAFFTVKEWKLSEGLRYDLQRDRDNLLGLTDQTGTVKANAMIASPWGVDGGATYSRSLVLNAVNPGNDRRAWTASLGYNVLKKEEHRVELRFRHTDNRFQTPNQDYKEMVWEFALNNRF